MVSQGPAEPVVCFFGTFDREYTRNRILLALLERAGWRVDLCHEYLWDSATRQKTAKGGLLRLIPRVAKVYSSLAWRGISRPRPSAFLVGYAGHIDVFLAALIARIRGVPLIFDVFLSLYDTAVLDRGVVDARSFKARVLRAIDRWGCRLSDLVLLDTPEHARFFAALTGVPENRFRVLWIGADDRLFQPGPAVSSEPVVLFYGTFIPLQGVTTIVQAAKLLEADGIQFRIIGRGQETPRVEALVKDLRPCNLEMIPWVEYAGLNDQIHRARLCLGIFGDTEKAARVVPNKVFECVASGKPVLTRDSPAIRNAFHVDREVAVCPPGDAEALALEIRKLMQDDEVLRALAEAGHARYLRDYSLDVLSGSLAEALREVKGIV